MSQGIRLQVQDSRQRDLGRGIARIDQKTMLKLGISAGGVIEICGKRTTSAIAWPAYDDDQNRDILRIDGFIRKNADTNINDYALVRAIQPKNADQIILAPVDMRLNVDNDFIGFVKNRLAERVLVEGDAVLVQMLGHSIPFCVLKARPGGIVKVASDTVLKIMNDPQTTSMNRITYADVGGLGKEISRIKEAIEMQTRFSEIFQQMGVGPATGILLYGPNGCGKTLLASAITNEYDGPTFAINAPEVLGKTPAETVMKMTELFRKAGDSAHFLIFIDHVDAIASLRSSKGEQNQIVDGFMALMDKTRREKNGKVMVIAATDRIDLIDPAFRTPTRFGIEIEIGLPDSNARQEILQVATRLMPLDKDVDLKKLSEMTEGFTGADLKALALDASARALQRVRSEIGPEGDGKLPNIMEKIRILMQDLIDATNKLKDEGARKVH